MKCKYIGKFDLESIIIDDKEIIALIPEGEDIMRYNVYDFKRAPHGSIFGAIYGDIGLQLNVLDNNAKLWTIS